MSNSATNPSSSHRSENGRDLLRTRPVPSGAICTAYSVLPISLMPAAINPPSGDTLTTSVRESSRPGQRSSVRNTASLTWGAWHACSRVACREASFTGSPSEGWLAQPHAWRERQIRISQAARFRIGTPWVCWDRNGPPAGKSPDTRSRLGARRRCPPESADCAVPGGTACQSGPPPIPG
jgi:hypothetical protein